MQKTSKLYFVALLPDENTSKLIYEYKQIIYHQFACKAALKSPAHITLIPPVSLSSEQLELLKQDVKKISHSTDSFAIDLLGWNNFATRTIYLDCQNNQDLAKIYTKCQKLAMKIGLKTDPRNFIPHITLANRDINIEQYANLWQLVNNMNYPKSVIINSIVIFEQTPTLWHPLFTLTLAAHENT